MTNDIEVSVFHRNDTDALRSFLMVSWQETYTEQLGQTTAELLISSLQSDTIGDLVSGRDERAYIATEGTNIIGCIISAARGNFLYIWGCYVLASHQRRGVGRKLMQSAIKEKGSSTIVQLIVLKQSLPAQCFYKHLGFVVYKLEDFELIPGQTFPALTLQVPVEQLESVLQGKSNAKKADSSHFFKI